MTDQKLDGPIEKLSFEEALAALEQVVSQLEGGQVPLEQSIAR
jgi:exodeoxyribonuclease VII small subunit